VQKEDTFIAIITETLCDVPKTIMYICKIINKIHNEISFLYILFCELIISNHKEKIKNKYMIKYGIYHVKERYKLLDISNNTLIFKRFFIIVLSLFVNK
jgi:hypothetical protein